MEHILDQETLGLRDMQQFHAWLDEIKGFDQTPLINLAFLAGEVGEVINAVRGLQRAEDDGATDQAHAHIAEELADCLAFIAKLGNILEIDLQTAYRQKMRHNIGRTWHPNNL